MYLAGSLHKEYEVIIIDGNLGDPNTSLYDLANNSLCVGISCMTGAQIRGALEFSKNIKSINPKIPVIWGGYHPSIFPDLTISSPLVDILVKGQGEYTFKELIQELSSSNPKLEDVPGIVYKIGRDVHHNEDRILMDKKRLPSFPWHLVQLDNYIRNDPKIGSRILNYVSSQGCPFPCTFCTEVSMYKRRWVSYGSNRIINDISYLVKKASVNAIKFYDANFFAHIPTALNIVNAILEKQLSITWAASGHPKILNSLDVSSFDLLQKSGCVRLLIGAESGAIDVLKLIKKMVHPDEILQLARKCSDYKIKGSFTFIIGFPRCDIQHEIDTTLTLGNKIRSIDPSHDVKVHFYAPYPGTPLFGVSCRYGFVPPKTLEEWSNYDYYNIETPWVNKNYENMIHQFNSNNCPYVHL